jgi:ornithine cyclodeaminase/thiomorpholine-carboxylate dehydrogenase
LDRKYAYSLIIFHKDCLVELLFLNQKEIQDLLDPDELIDALADGLMALSQGEAIAPNRTQVTVPDSGYLMAMPAWQPGAVITVKLITVFPENQKSGLPGHQALICAFDPNTGTPVALMDGTYITAMRTAGGAALSIKLLSRKNPRVLTIIGAGVQGASHLKICSRSREFEEIRIASYYFEDAQKLAHSNSKARPVESFEEAVHSADVICLCTTSSSPVIESAWISPGAHITSVGYTPPGSELPRDIIARARLFVETRHSFEPPPTGCCELAGLDPATGTELGEILLGKQPGRQSEDEITLYKSMGHAIEDLAAANLVYLRAKQQGAGSIAQI